MRSAQNELTFDLAEIPFSRSGSWLNVAAVTAEHVVADDLHLITHRTGFHAVLALVPWRADSRITTDIRVTPSVLTWSDTGAGRGRRSRTARRCGCRAPDWGYGSAPPRPR